MTAESAHATAKGKVILLGEHAVVHGGKAIAAGLDREARAVARRRPGASSSVLRLGNLEVEAHAGVSPGRAGGDLARAFAELLAGLDVSGSVEVEAASDLPPGGGLGSSAALGVAIARALIRLLRGPDDDTAALAAARAWETVFHGRPSGIDTEAAARGGCFTYTREHGSRPLLPAVDLVLCIGSSGVGSSTREMVASVARLKDKKPDMVDKSLAGIASIVENGALAIEAGDLSALGKLFDLNQMILAGLMVSTEAIERLCRTARDAGALGAKLTGAGGGGCVVALAPSSRLGSSAVSVAEADEAARRILDAWAREGFSGFVARVRGKKEVLA